MARRRALGAGFGTASKMIQSFLNDSLERGRQSQLQQMITERQQGTDRINFAQNLLPKFLEGGLKPDALSPEMQQLTSQFYDPMKVAPSLQERLGKIATEATKGNTFGSIPSDPEVVAQLAAAGIPTEQNQLPDVVAQALGGARARTSQLEPLKDLSFVDQKGIRQSQQVPQSQAPAYGALPQERTPEQEGQRDLGTALSGKLSPAYGVAEARVKNTIEALTRPEQVKTAGAVAGAEAGARYGAEFNPNIVNARVDQAGRVAGAQKSAELDATQAKQGVGGTLQVDERRAMTYLNQLTAAHADVLELENQKGVGLTPQALTAAQPGVVGSAIRSFISPKDQLYVQRAKNFTNIEGLIKSGVTVREDEYANYLTNNFKVVGETPEVTKKKQQTREAIIASAVAASGRGAHEGGVMMADAVIKGLIPPEVITSFQISNPQFESGLLETLAPYFDITQDVNGKMHMVRKAQ